MKMSTIAGYTGHGAKTGGLQGHSVGEWFPLTIIGKSIRGALYWCVFDTRTGNEGTRRRSYQEAQLDLVGIRIRNLINE